MHREIRAKRRQQESGDDDARQNGRKVRQLMRQAAAERARLVQFPEGLLSGYAKEQIADWDDRLASREALLKTQYANLETALGKLKDQSTWLAGQLAHFGGEVSWPEFDDRADTAETFVAHERDRARDDHEHAGMGLAGRIKPFAVHVAPPGAEAA